MPCFIGPTAESCDDVVLADTLVARHVRSAGFISSIRPKRKRWEAEHPTIGRVCDSTSAGEYS